MRPSILKCTTLFAAASLMAAVAATAVQDRPGERDRDRPMQPMHPTAERDVLHHVDDIHGKNVINLNGERLGTIDSLIVDVDAGKAEFAVLATGGWLGMGENLFAVPWDSFELRPLTDALILNVTAEQLEGAQQFDRDELARYGERDWTQRMRDFFRTTPDRRMDDRPMRERDRRLDRPGERRGQNPEHPEQQRRVPPRDDERYEQVTPVRPQFLLSTDLIGMKVQDTAGQQLGRVRDLAMGLHTTEIAYAVIGAGGFLGIAERDIAVAWKKLELRGVERDEMVLVLDMTREQIEQAPEYHRDHLPSRERTHWMQTPGHSPRQP